MHAHMPKDLSNPLSEAEKAMFREVAAVMARHNTTRKFSLALTHQHFDLRDGEVLHETTDVDTRVSTVRPVPKSEMPEGSFPTQWNVCTEAAGDPTQYCCTDIHPMQYCCTDVHAAA